jgi:hypothetical protein
MKFTNERNLPAPLVRALQASTYDRQTNRVSVTDLQKSVRAYVLGRKHEADITEDVSEQLWRFIGSATGAMLEAGEGANDLKEERLTVGDITGRFDFYEGNTQTLYDYKVTSVYKVKAAEYDDYRLQLSLYADLMEAALKFPVAHIKNVLILRDWSKYDAAIAECPIVVVEHERLREKDGIPLMQWASDRVAQLRAAEHLPEDSLPECDEDYRWATSDKWAVMWNESTAKEPRAVSVFDVKENAEADALALGLSGKGKKTYRVDLRPGDKWKRCAYCLAREFCGQYKAANPDGIPQ